MEMMNRAIEDAADYQGMMKKITEPVLGDPRERSVYESRTQRRERERREKNEASRAAKLRR